MRLVATDLDGTLLRPEQTVSARSVRALQRCRDQGVDVVLVTGRPQRWLSPVRGLMPPDTIALCSNGAVVVHVDDDTMLSARTFTPAQLAESIEALRACMPSATFGLEATEGPLWETGFPARNYTDAPPPIAPLHELLARRPAVIKLLCRTEDLHADDMLARARAALAGLAEPVHSNPLGQMLEISTLGVTKASALAEYAASRGIDASEVVAFGDMPNDVSMLRWAGLGYAMANGHAEAIAAADAMAPSSEHDGVAQVLEALLDAAPSAVGEQVRRSGPQ